MISAALPADLSEPRSAGLSKGTSRPAGSYAQLNGVRLFLKGRKFSNDRNEESRKRIELRTRGGHLSQRVSTFSSPALAKDFFPPISRPLLVQLTEARRQIMAAQGAKVPPRAAAAPVGSKSAKGFQRAMTSMLNPFGSPNRFGAALNNGVNRKKYIDALGCERLELS
jgi:hypothetical protein